MTNKELDKELSRLLSDFSFIKDLLSVFFDAILLVTINFLCKHLPLRDIFFMIMMLFLFYSFSFRFHKNKSELEKLKINDNDLLVIITQLTDDNIKYLKELQEREKNIASKTFIDIFYAGLVLNILNESINKSLFNISNYIYIIGILLFLIMILIALINNINRNRFNDELSRLRNKIINLYYLYKNTVD